MPVSEEPMTAPGIPSWLAKLPRNEVLKLRVQEKEIAIPRLATSANRSVSRTSPICTMSGRIARTYSDRMADEVNALEPDLVAITGDIVEYAKCMSWIPSTLGRLRATSGVYYVLGNHDRKVDEFPLNTALAEAGLQYLGGTYRTLTVAAYRSYWPATKFPGTGRPPNLQQLRRPTMPPACRCASCSPIHPTSFAGHKQTTST